MSLYKSSSLVMIPTAYKDGKLYSVRPTDGSGDFTFSRGSNLAATRVASSGYIEKGRENDVLYSNAFTGATWVQSNITQTTGFADPFGGSNANKFLETTANDQHRFYNSFQVKNYSIYTQSVYVKPIGRTQMLYGTESNSLNFVYDFTTESIVSTFGSMVDYGVTSVGNGWYRFSLTFVVGGNFNHSFLQGYVGGSTIYAGDVTKGFYAYGSQLEAGLVATDYIETGASTAQAGILEDMPRLDYSGGASCPALLLEPQRTNSISQSEYFELFSAFNNPSITSNYSVSPEGVTNATRLLLTAQSLSRIETLINTGTTIANNNQTISCWVKSNGADTEFRLKCTHSSVLDYYSPNLTATSKWQRFTFTQLFGAGSSTIITAGILNSSTNNAADLSIYGMQLEINSSYPTSYIPTYGSSVTRSQEYGRTPHSSYEINEEQGVIFAEFEYLGGTDFQVVSMHNGGSLVDWLMVDSAGRLRGSVFYNSTYKVTMDSSPTTLSANTNYKAAFRYESGNNALYLNGVKVGTNTQTFLNPPTLPYVQLGGFWQLSNTNVNCKIKQTALFNTALTDAELAALTA